MENANSFGLLDCVTFRRNHDVISMGVCQLPEVVNPDYRLANKFSNIPG